MANEPLLKLGGDNDLAAVKELQRILHEQGYWERPISGRFGKMLDEAVGYFQQTHLDQDGRPLKPDGVVWTKTWWALRNPSGSAQRSFIDGKIPAGLSDARTHMLMTALKEHDAKEQPNGSNRGPLVDRYLPQWCITQGGKGPAWCCFFVSFVTKESMGKYPLGGREGACWRAHLEAKKRGMWHPNDGSYVPRPGDAFVMLYKGSKKGHIGFVLRVDPSDCRFNTVEGNCGNRVKLGLRDYDDDQRIAGFINFYGDESAGPTFEYGIIEARDVGADGTR